MRFRTKLELIRIPGIAKSRSVSVRYQPNEFPPLSLPHDHELHEDVPQRPQPGQGDRGNQKADGRAAVKRARLDRASGISWPLAPTGCRRARRRLRTSWPHPPSSASGPESRSQTGAFSNSLKGSEPVSRQPTSCRRPACACPWGRTSGPTACPGFPKCRFPGRSGPSKSSCRSALSRPQPPVWRGFPFSVAVPLRSSSERIRYCFPCGRLGQQIFCARPLPDATLLLTRLLNTSLRTDSPGTQYRSVKMDNNPFCPARQLDGRV